jgi:sporulation protein YlmC with PRC-barrel domain
MIQLKGDAVMWTKQSHGLSRIFWGCFLVGAFLVFLCSPALAAEVKSKPIEPRSGKMDLQEGYRVSRIIDHTVRNDRGEELGEVDDLIMSRNGKIKKVILSVGGFLGVGFRLVAVSFKSLQMGEKGDIVYKITKQQLENHPEFSYRKEGLYGNYFPPEPTYRFPYNPGYYYPLYPPYPPYPRPPYGKPYGRIPEERRKEEYYYPWTWEYFPERLQISAILNRNVLNEKGEIVGDLYDLIISPNGKAQEIILSVGEFLGIEEKRVAMPFEPLKITDVGVVYNVTRRELENRPALSTEKQ